MAQTEIPEDIRRMVEIGIPGWAVATPDNIRYLAGLLVLAEREAATAKERAAVAKRALNCAAIYEDGFGERNKGAASAMRQFGADMLADRSIASSIRGDHHG